VSADLLEHPNVVQIDPRAPCHEELRGQLAFVIELKPWGIIAGVPIPGGYAPVRLSEDHYRPVGRAPWVPSWAK
jgi:hypothetical protein